LLARWAERPALSPGPIQLPAAGDPSSVVRRFGEACVANRHRERSLGEMLGPLLTGVAQVERVPLARMLEPMLPELRFDDRARAPARRSRARRKRRRK
jgi:hypothetical protein